MVSLVNYSSSESDSSNSNSPPKDISVKNYNKTKAPKPRFLLYSSGVHMYTCVHMGGAEYSEILLANDKG